MPRPCSAPVPRGWPGGRMPRAGSRLGVSCRASPHLPPDLSSDWVFRTGAAWLAGREDAPEWSYVWRFLLEHRRCPTTSMPRPCSAPVPRGWPGGRMRRAGPTSGSVFVQHLPDLPSDLSSDWVFRTGVAWLAGEDAPEWNFVWKLSCWSIGTRPDETDAPTLFLTGAAWLSGREDTPEWSHVCVFHSSTEVVPGDIDVAGLVRTGVAWL